MTRNSNVPRSHEDHINQASEEIEGGVTKKLSHEFSGTENRILGALSRPDDFQLNPLIQGHSGTAPETSRNAYGTNQGTNEDASQSDPPSEAGIFQSQTTHNSGPDDGHDMVTGATERHDMVTGVQKESLCGHDMVTGATERHDMLTGFQKESLCGHDMVTGATERHDMVTGVQRETGATKQIRNRHDMVKGVHEEVTYCSLSRSSGKQKKSRSTSQPLFCSEVTTATIEADQTLLALQQLANNNNSANFNNIINRISKLPKSFTTMMPTFDGNSEKFELFESLFQTSPKIHIQLTEENRINYFHSIMKGDAIQTFKNTNGATRDNLGEILAVFRRKYVKPQSMATAEQKFQKIVFNPAKQKLVVFLDELEKLAKGAFGTVAYTIIGQFLHAKMPPHLETSINQAYLENRTYEHIVTHLERKFELNGLESPDGLQINVVSHYATNTNAERPKPTCHHCKKQGSYGNQCPLLNKKEQLEGTQINPAKKNGAKNSIPNNNNNNSNNKNNKNSNRAERKPKIVYPRCKTCGKTSHPTERCYVRANAAKRPLPWKSKPQGQNAHHQQDAQNSMTG